MNEQYKNWKVNSRFLYDVVLSHALEWPSLTVQWLPDAYEYAPYPLPVISACVPARPCSCAGSGERCGHRSWIAPCTRRAPGSGLTERRLIIGNHTSEAEQNYLMVVRCILPDDDDNAMVPQQPPPPPPGLLRPPPGRCTRFRWNVPWLSAARPSSAACPESAGGDQVEEPEARAKRARIEIVKRVNHEGEVNRARYMPQRTNMVATKAPSGDVLVFDINAQPERPSTDGVCRPDLKLTGHDKEGYGLSWNLNVAGRVLSGSDDSTICVWDIEGDVSKDGVEPLATYKGHSSAVADVAWHALKQNVFGSVGDDKHLLIWDDLVADKKPVQSVMGHAEGINCLAFNPFNTNLLATGSADKTVAVWDLRNTAAHLHAFDVHDEEVVNLQWNPHFETVLASCSEDRKVNVLDLSRIGEEQSKEDAEDGPPELLFQHGGHTDKVRDLSWSPTDPWLMSTVSEDNILQVWQMASHIYKDDEDDTDVDMKALED